MYCLLFILKLQWITLYGIAFKPSTKTHSSLIFYFSEEINESQLNSEKCSIESSVMHQTCKHSNDSYLTCLAKHKMCFENFTFDL